MAQVDLLYSRNQVSITSNSYSYNNGFGYWNGSGNTPSRMWAGFTFNIPSNLTNISRIEIYLKYTCIYSGSYTSDTLGIIASWVNGYTSQVDLNGGNNTIITTQTMSDFPVRTVNDYTGGALYGSNAYPLPQSGQHTIYIGNCSVTHTGYQATDALVRITGDIAQETVSFNSNGGTGTMSSISATAGNDITLPNSSFTPPQGSTSQTTTSYNVTFKGNGSGVTNLPTSISITATRGTGYSFKCWNTNASGTGTNLNSGANYTVPSGGSTLYAKWQSSTVDTLNSVTVPNTEPQLTGKVFQSWNTQVNGSGNSYRPGDTISFNNQNITSDVVLYAMWGTTSSQGIYIRTGSGATDYAAAIPYVRIAKTGNVTNDWKQATVHIRVKNTGNPATDWKQV